MIGSRFTARYELADAADEIETVGPVIVPTISGRAWITAESTLLLDDDDPFRGGRFDANRASA